MPPSDDPFTQADLDQVRDAAHKLVMEAPSLVGDHPLLAVGALSLATVHAAVLTDTSFDQLVELIRLQFERAAADIAQCAQRESRQQEVS